MLLQATKAAKLWPISALVLVVHCSSLLSSAQTTWQQQQTTSFGDEEPAIVINSRHSAAKAAASHQLQQRRFNTHTDQYKHQSVRQQQQAASRPAPAPAQPSQEFDSTIGSAAVPTSTNRASAPPSLTPPPSQSQSRRQSSNREPVGSSLIRDTSDLLAASQQHELEQRRTIVEQSPPSTTTTESWMQSVRDNHHGPIRSRFNLLSAALSSSSSSSWMDSSQLGYTRRLVSGEQVIPVGDTQQLVLDGHMKPGPSQPVPYEQQNLAKSVRTAEQAYQAAATTSADHRPSTRRNSKFTRRSTDYVDLAPDSSTTPLYQEKLNTETTSKISTAQVSSERPRVDSTTIKTLASDKTRVADFKTILMSNNHRPMSGTKLKERHSAAVGKLGAPKGRSLALDQTSKPREAGQLGAEPRQQQQHQQQPQTKGGWSRLLPNLLHRTFNGVFKRLTTNTSSQAMQGQQPAAQNLFNSFMAPPSGLSQAAASVFSPTPTIQTTPPPHIGVVNYIASALSAAIAAANRPSPAQVPKIQQPIALQTADEEHHQLAHHEQLLGGPLAGSNSMRHETREPGLRQHANKKIIDSFVDLPVSERRTLDLAATIDRRDGLVGRPANGTSRKARMSEAAGIDQDFEVDLPLDTAAASTTTTTTTTKGNGSWILASDPIPEPAAEFYLGSNFTLTEVAADSRDEEEEGATRTELADPGELDENDQLDFRTTTDGSVVAGDADASEADDETLDAADSIIVPERMAYEVAHDLGEPVSSSNEAGHRGVQDQSDDSGGDQPEDDEEESSSNGEVSGYSLFYAPAPSDFVKNYRKESGSDFSGDGEGSFARISPMLSSNRHKLSEHRNSIRRPQLATFRPSSNEDDSMEVDDPRSGMTFMMIPSRMRPDRRRPSSNSQRKPASRPTSVPAISLKETRRPTSGISSSSSSGNRNKNKSTSPRPLPAGGIFTAWPKVQEPPKQGDMLSPMSSSISVMDLDPSMTRLAHNKLIVAKFKPKFKQQQKPAKPANLIHRSTSVELPALRKQTVPSSSASPPSLSSALLGSNNFAHEDTNLNELVSRRWQPKPRFAPASATTTTTTTEAAITSSEITPTTARSQETESSNQLSRIAGDFQFLMPGLASGLAARISSLTRPYTSSTTTTPTPGSDNEPRAQTQQTLPVEPGQREGLSSYAESPSSSSPSSSSSATQTGQSYGGNRNDKFNFSLMQMNNRERINPLLFPVERFSNSSSYSVQQQQKEQQKNKPANHRSRVTTSTPRPTTIRQQSSSNSSLEYTNTSTTTTTTSAPKPRTSQRPAAPYFRSTTTTTTTTTTTDRPKTTQRTTTTTGAEESVGQILRNQHHHTTSYGQGPKPPTPQRLNRPLTESERLRNQYLAMIGKNSSLDGRIWQTEPPSTDATVLPTGSPLGHMSLIEEAAHDSNRYTTLDASPPAGNEESTMGEHSIVILSDNHHRQASSTRRNGTIAATGSNSNRLPPFNAGHTKYELTAGKPVQDTARKHLEEFMNGTRIRPSSMSKLVSSMPSAKQQANNNTVPLPANRRTLATAFNSVQGSPPSPPVPSGDQPLIGKLDQELLLGAVFDGDLNQPSKSFQPKQPNSSSDHDRIKTHSTITLTPVPPVALADTSTVDIGEPTTLEPTTAHSSDQPEPERVYLDLGESGDLNNRASMRKNQAKIQSILSAIANRTKTPPTQAPASSSESNGGDNSDQEFKTTLADYPTSSGSSSSQTEDDMETTKFYAPLKLTTRSSYFRPPMSTPAPGRAYPNIETSGSRQKINRPALDSGASFEYSPMPMPTSQAPPSSMPTTKLTESLTNDQLKQTIKDRIGYQSDQSSTPSMDSLPETTTTASPEETSAATESGQDAHGSATAETTPEAGVGGGDGHGDNDPEVANRRRPTTVSASGDYPEMPTFPQTRPPRPVIIRRRPTKRPPPQRLAIGQSDEDLAAATDYGGERPLIVANKPRRKKKPTKRPPVQDTGEPEVGYESDKRKIIYRPINVAELGESPVLIRKRPGYIRPPNNIHIHAPPQSAATIDHRNKTLSRPGVVSAPVSIMLPTMESMLKKKDHDIRTRPLTIMDPQSTSSTSPGDHLTNENILSPAILNRVPETTIMHDKMLVSYKPGRPLPGSMSSFGNFAHPKLHGRPQPPLADVDSTASLVDSLINSITTSVAPTSPTNSTSFTVRPPQLGSGNGGDTHLISIEQQQREQQTTRLPPTPTSTPASSTTNDTQIDHSSSSLATTNHTQASGTNSNHRPIIVINGLFGGDTNNQHDQHQQQHPQKPQSHEPQHHAKRPNSSLGSNSLLEAGSMSVVAQASHGQSNSSRPWYPTAAVSSWPAKQNNSLGQDQSFNSNSSSSSTASDLSSSSSTSVEQSVFGGSEMPNFGGPSSQPSGSYQNHQMQNQQPIGMPHQGGSMSGSRPGSRPGANKPWRVRRRPSGNGPSSSSGGGGGGNNNNAGYNFNSASSVSNYVYRPLLSSVSSFGVLFDNLQIFFARIRTFIISLMVMFLPPLALAASVVNAMSA